MNTLEAFWCGNMGPSEYDAGFDPACREILQPISRNEEKFL